jgi:hypothetical protein
LSQWLNALLFIATSEYSHWAIEQFDEKISTNKRDFDTRFAKARMLMALREWTAAMDELLEIIMRDKKGYQRKLHGTWHLIFRPSDAPHTRSGGHEPALLVFRQTQMGAGGVLLQGLPLTCACSSQSRRNCLS